MIVMASVTLIGCGIAVVAALFINHHASGLRQAAKDEVNHEVQVTLKRAKDLDAKLAENLLGAADMDGAIEDFTRARSAIFSVPTETPWLWDSDHLENWSQNLLAAKERAITRRSRLWSLSLLVGVILAVVIVDAILYDQIAKTSPALTPQLPAKFQPLPVAPEQSSANPDAVTNNPNP
jgi:hypothetical protein